MRFKSVLFLGLAASALALSACDPIPTQAQDCPAGDYRGLIGTNIAAATFPSSLNARIIYPDTAVTMDFVSSRMNILVDKNGIVTDLTCG